MRDLQTVVVPLALQRNNSERRCAGASLPPATGGSGGPSPSNLPPPSTPRTASSGGGSIPVVLCCVDAHSVEIFFCVRFDVCRSIEQGSELRRSPRQTSQTTRQAGCRRRSLPILVPVRVAVVAIVCSLSVCVFSFGDDDNFIDRRKQHRRPNTAASETKRKRQRTCALCAHIVAPSDDLSACMCVRACVCVDRRRMAIWAA